MSGYRGAEPTTVREVREWASDFVERHGWLAFAGLTALIWALPLMAWAGGVDFNPQAWWALYAAGPLFVIWLVLVTRARRWQPAASERRLDLSAMTRAERFWRLGLFLCLTGLLGWLSAVLTVDWGLLGPGLATGAAGAYLLAGLAVGLPLALLALAAVCWRGGERAFKQRISERASE